MSRFAISLIWLFATMSTFGASNAQQPVYAGVTQGRVFAFPADHGSHPGFRTEWWYVTGTFATPDDEQLGFQITFFRTRPPIDQGNMSAFSPKQIIFAHVALSDPRVGKLDHDQRVARSGFGLAGASTGNADVNIKDWLFKSDGTNRFAAKIATKNFKLDLGFEAQQSILLQGENGFSKKGPNTDDASHYYSIPQLLVSGTLTRNGEPQKVAGKAWLDHEWSSQYLNPVAAGWDWTGLNFDDGSALMGFRMRRSDGSTLWAGGTFRRTDGTVFTLEPEMISFQTVSNWQSGLTNATYPVKQSVVIKLPEGSRAFLLTPIFENQELDGRASGLPVYWEGAVTTPGGAGYLELTGYVDRPQL